MNKPTKMEYEQVQFQMNRNWRNFQRCKSLLEQTLSNLSKKSEDELSKRELLELISVNCDYMRSLNLYNYWREQLRLLNQRKLDTACDNNE